MILRWHEQAKAEADNAAAFYCEIQPELALRFVTDIEDAFAVLRDFRTLFRVWKVTFESVEQDTFLLV
jgi:plasmid stabilization system protein ParE